VNKSLEQKNVALLAIGLICITLIVFTKNISDPVNAPKLLALGITSFCALCLFVLPNVKFLFDNHKAMFLVGIFTPVVMLIASFSSESPFSQNWYGVQGRNTGFLAHIGFLILTISLLTIREIRSVDKVLAALLVSGFVNILYCLWVLLFGDFIGWNNQYKALLGSFGNPNFISSFLGIQISLFISFLFLRKQRLWQYLIAVCLTLLSIFEIYMTRSIQGFILVAVAIYINFFFFIHTKIGRATISVAYLVFGLCLSLLGLLGVNGQGPLASILFQETFIYRKQYWLAGLEMGMSNLFTGVGLDSYGDWYRQLRTEESTISPGLDVVTNVAHNIYIDAFANGGILFLCCYLVPGALALVSIIKFSRQVKQFDFRFVSLVTAWFCYQIQSLISISQIGISIWGWVLSGLLIVYPKLVSSRNNSNQKIARPSVGVRSLVFARTPILAFSSLLAFLVYAPPLLADYKWTSAYLTRDANKIYSSLNETYFAPSNSFRLAQAAQIFEASNLSDQSLSIAQRATRFNPRNFDGWQLLYFVKNSTTNEKIIAKKKMIEQDPLNPKWRRLE
jgi:hypothetical protein